MRDGGRAEKKRARSSEAVCRRVQARTECAVFSALLFFGKELSPVSTKHRVYVCAINLAHPYKDTRLNTGELIIILLRLVISSLPAANKRNGFGYFIFL